MQHCYSYQRSENSQKMLAIMAKTRCLFQTQCMCKYAIANMSYIQQCSGNLRKQPLSSMKYDTDDHTMQTSDKKPR